IAHQETVISVSTFYTGAVAPLEGVKVYLFNEAGSYLNQNAVTGDQGEVAFNLPEKSYKVRVDYLGSQYWSEVFQWQDEEVVIDEGVVDLHVTWNGAEVSNAPVYLFTETGSYLSRSVNTDGQGYAQFTVPVKGYKFRIDYNGQQYWTSVITPIAHQLLVIEAPLEQLALMRTNDPVCMRQDLSIEPEMSPLPEQGVKVASLGSMLGLLTQTTVAQVAQPKVYYFHTDHLGTPQKLTDTAGAVVWSGDYKPFGEVLIGASTIQNYFRFPGQYFDHETSLHYNYHRYYQLKNGRYMSPDPIGQGGGIDPFSYASGNPIRFVDPLALSVIDYYYKNIVACIDKFGRDTASCRILCEEAKRAVCNLSATLGFHDCIENFWQAVDLNKDGTVDGWDEFWWVFGRFLLNFFRGSPPFMPSSPGLGPEGPGSSDPVWQHPKPEA
ncbi:MAG: hypothetical protein C4576_35575, partial [Desulfobacteraceae bacterium]